MKKTNYILARYDSKTEECIGVYETFEEAILKVWGYSKNNPKYKNAQNCIYSSILSFKNNYIKKRSANGYWYKIECD